MAYLTYLDASGSALDPKVKAISVGGFIAHEDAWARFEREWPPVMKHFGVAELHMRDFAHSRREYESWKGDHAKRDAFIDAVAHVINGCVAISVGAILPLSVYRLFNRDFCVDEIVGMSYTMAVFKAIANSMDWREKNKIEEPMQFLIERGDNQQSDFRKFITSVITWKADYVAESVFLSKKEALPNGEVRRVLPFQAADFIAYEQAKAVTDMIVLWKTLARQSFRKLLIPIEDLPRARTFWTIMERTSFAKAIRQFDVPRRFNHFRDKGVDRRKYFAPLGYIDTDHPVIGYLDSYGFIE